MNKIFRIIRHRVTGEFVVVSELTSSLGVSRSSSANPMNDVDDTSVKSDTEPDAMSARLLSATMMVLLGTATIMLPVQAQQAPTPTVTTPPPTQIIADKNAPANQRPTVLPTGNGSTQINITTPSQAGVSMNQYSQFDVGPNGAILNNSRGNVNSQTAGWIQGNPWLATGTARIIVNQVNSVNPSYLNGNIEVAGDRAEVVMANAAGIQVNGAGFINAGKVTLTTGAPILNGGALEGYRVSQGQIRVDGDGLNTGDADYTNIFARGLELNAGIWAKELQVVTGANQIDAANAATAIAGTGTAPTIAIDSSALGGMYAGKISLIGTEAGLGFNNAGTIAASAGQVTIDVNGQLTNAGTVAVNGAANALSVKATGLDNSGTLSTQGNASIAVAGNTKNTGLIAAARELQLGSQTIDNLGGSLSAQRLDISAQALTNTGKIQQTGAQALDISAATVVNANKASMGVAPIAAPTDPTDPTNPTNPTDSVTPPSTATGGSEVTVTTPPPETFATGRIQITNGLTNTDGGVISGNGDTTVTATSGLSNTDGATLQVKTLNVSGDTLRNSGEIFYQNGNLNVQHLNNDQGKLGSNAALNFNLQSLSNRGGALTTAQTFTANVAQDIDNDGGSIASQGALTLDASNIHNASGTIISNTAAVTLNADGTLTNDAGVIQSATDLSVDAQDVSNVDGKILSGGKATLNVANDVNNTQGVIVSKDLFTLNANALNNTRGTVGSQDADTVLNVRAQMQNQGGTVISGGVMALQSQGFDNRDGRLIAGTLRVDAGTGLLNNDRGTLAGNTVELKSGDLSNTEGLIQAQDALTIDASGVLTNASSGTEKGIRSGNTLNLSAGTLNNDTGVVIGIGNVNVLTQSISNQLGQLASAANLSVQSQDLRNGGSIQAGQNAQIQVANTLNNNNGQLLAQNALTVTAGSLSNAQGSIASIDGDTGITTTQGLDNTDGTIQSHHRVTLDSQGLVNTRGQIAGDAVQIETHQQAFVNQAGSVTGNALNVNSGALNNDAGLLQSATDLNVNTNGATLTNTNSANAAGGQGGLRAGGNLAVDAGDLNNTAGQIGSVAATRLNVANLDNTQGMILAGAGLTVQAANVSNAQGQISSNGDATLALTGALNNNDGQVIAANQLTVNAATASNARGTIGSIAGDVAVTTTNSLDNAQGIIQGSRAVTLTSSGLNNQAGQIIGATTSIDTRQQALQNQAGTIAGQSVDVRSGTITNDAGLIQSSTNLTIDTNGALLSNTNSAAGPNGQGGLRAGQAISLTTGALDNSTGLIGSGDGTTIVASDVVNANGQVVAGTGLSVTAQSLDNANGQIQSGQNTNLQIAGTLSNAAGQVIAGKALSVTANTLANVGGTIGSIDGDTTITTATALNNAQGKIQSSANLSVDSQGLNNTDGVLVGTQTTIETHAQALDNTRGTIAGTAVTVNSGALSNDAGLLQSSGTLLINTNGQQLRNANSGTQAGISAGGELQINAGDLENSTGVIAGNANTVIDAATLNNQSGLIQSQQTLSIQSSALNNQQGQILGVGDTTLELGSSSLNNEAGLLQSTAALTVNAAHVNNANTASTDPTKPLGMLAGTVTVNAATVNNQSGTITGDDRVALNGQGEVDNRLGTISSQGTVAIKDAGYTRTILNDGGKLVAGELLDVQVKNISGTGTLESGLDMSLDYADPISNDNTIAANRNLTLKTQGDLTNRGQINAGRNLEVAAQNVSNEATGEISAADGLVHVKAVDSVTNRGLIDGVDTHVEASTLDNLGTGRIYGDYVAIAATTLNNADETVAGVTKAGTIAAREQLDIGAQTLNNLRGALIYSDGDASIGGALDANRIATGTAMVVNNTSATIDIANDLSIDATTINNVRENVSVTQQASIDETVNMTVLPWQKIGSNRGPLSNTSNYRAWQVFYLDPSQILETSPVIPPDGTQHTDGSPLIWKAVIKVTANTSMYYGASGGLSGSRGERWRLNPTEGTYTIYYRVREDGQSNPDQVPGGDVPFSAVGMSESFNYETNTLSYSNAYGTCSTNCVQLVGAWQYTDPATQIENRNQVPGPDIVEVSRVAHHTAVDDVLNPNAGARAVIRAGQNMFLTTENLNNNFGEIAAGGNLVIKDHGGGTGNVTNVAMTLSRTHSFNNISKFDDGSQAAFTKPSMSEVIGQVGGSITAGGTLVIDTGTLDNFNTGRDAPNIVTNVTFASQGLVNVPGANAGSGPNLQDGTTTQTVDTATLGTDTTELATTTTTDVTTAPVGGTTNVSDGTEMFTGDGVSILTATNPGQVPASSLFAVNPNASGYYFETDPRFTNYRNWLSSDWMLDQLGIDPLSMHKRLGDGYYEQKLIRDQIGQLTGRRFLDGYSNDDAQYKALMQAGLTFAQQFGLRPGVSLSADQVARLTSDIVWLVEQEVTLPDGRKVMALVPKVYVAVRTGDLTRNGALLAGNQIHINLNKDFTNSGDIAGREVVAINANNISNLRGGVISAGTLALTAKTDINNIGSTLKATDAIALNAGNNINIQSTTASQRGTGMYAWTQTTLDRVAGLYVTNPNGLGVIAMNAGNDVNLIAANISNAGKNGITQISAGNNINLGTVQTGQSQDATFDEKNFRRSSSTTEVGTTISGANHIQLLAGTDINSRGGNITSQDGQVALVAGRDVNLLESRNTSEVSGSQTSKKSGLLSSTKTLETWDTKSNTANGTTISGDSVVVQAGRDITTRGADVVATNNVQMIAGRDLTIGAAQNTSEEHYTKSTRKSGISSDGGTGLTIGSSKQSTDTQINTLTHTGSTIGSIDGRVDLSAGNAVKIEGSDVLSATGTSIIGKTVEITNTTDTRDVREINKTSSSGIHVSLKGGAADTANAVIQSTKRASEVSDPRLKALYAAKTAQTLLSNGQAGMNSLKQAGNQISGLKDSAAAKKPGDGGAGMSLRVGIGASSSKSDTSTHDETVNGSRILSDGNVVIQATEGDVTIQGSEIEGENVLLDAAKNLNIRSAQEHNTSENKSKASSGEIGFTMGSEAGFGIYVSASAAKGNGTGDTVNHVESTIKARDTLVISSGTDTTIQGAQLSGNTVLADVGRNLTITSDQDTDTYKRKDQSAGIDAAIGTGGGSVSVNYNQSKMNSDYKSVVQQSGIQAGSGGFDINVQGHTQLNGAAIASTADPSKNSLTTGSLAYTDLENTAKYNTSSVGISVSGGTDGGSISPSLPMAQKDSTSSTTKSGIADGTLIVKDGSGADIARGTTALQQEGLKPIFDEEKIYLQQELAQLTGEVGFRAAGDFAAKMDWDEGSRERAALHAVVGAAMAGLGGGNIADGLTGAAVNQLVLPKMIEILKGLGFDDKSPDFKLLMQLGSTIVGSVVGGSTGGSVALSATTNNWLYHHERMALLDATHGCDVQGDAAACAEKSRLMVLSESRNKALANACIVKEDSSACSVELRKVQDAQKSVNTAEARAEYDEWMRKYQGDFSGSADLRVAFAKVQLGHAVSDDTLRRGLCAYFGGCTTNQNLADWPQWVDDALAGKDPNTSPEEVHQSFALLKELNAQYSRTGAWAGFTESPKQFIEYMRDVGARAMKEDPELFMSNPGLAIEKVLAKDALSSAVNLAKNLDKVLPALREWAIDIAKGFDSVDQGHPELSLYDLAKNNGALGGLAFDVSTSVVGPGLIKVAGKAYKLVDGAWVDLAQARELKNALLIAELEATENAKVLNNFYKDDIALPFPQEIKTSSGFVIRPNPDKVTTVLGTFVADTDSIINGQLGMSKTVPSFGSSAPGSFNLLNTPDSLYKALGPDKFWEFVNKPFLDNAIRRGDDIYLATSPNNESFYRKTAEGIAETGFKKEYDYLVKSGYKYDVKKGRMCLGGCSQ